MSSAGRSWPLIGSTCITALLLFGSASGQTWRRAFGAYGPEAGQAVFHTADDKIMVVGSTGSFGGGGSDIYVLLLDSEGALLWSRVIGGAGVEQGYAMAPAADGGYVIAGITNTEGEGGYDGLLVHLDAGGAVTWQRTYGGADWDFFQRVTVLADGGYLLAGHTYSYGSGGDAWLLRMDAAGDTLWTRHTGGLGDDEGTCAIPTPDGGVAFTGSVVDATGDPDAFLVKYDPDGAEQWMRRYGGDELDLARDVIATMDGGFSLVGSTASFSEWTEHYHVRVDASGSLLWERHWGQINDQEAYQHRELPSGRFLTTGYTRTSGGGGADMFLFLAEQNGDFVWQRSYGGSEDDGGMALDLMPDGGAVICGSTRSFGAGNTDVFVVRVDSDGATASESVDDTFDPLSVNDGPELASVALFPMPCDTRFHLRGAGRWRAVQLIDGAGRLLHQWPVQQSGYDVAAFAAGTYVVRLIAVDGSVSSIPLFLQR